MPELPPPPADDKASLPWQRWVRQLWDVVRGLRTDVDDITTDLTSVVTLTGAQLLEDKTLDAPILTGTVGGTPAFGAGTTVAPGAWQTATLINSWVDHGGYGAVPQYRKLADGNVQIRGGIKSGTTVNGTTVFTLASGFRPTGKHLVLAAQAGGDCFVEVNTDGTVKIYNVPSAINNAELALSGITFPTT